MAQSKLTEAFSLAVFPLVGTCVAYLFEFGFAWYHGIPTSLIQLSVSQFVGSGVLGLLLLWLIHFYLSFGLALLRRRNLLVFRLVGIGILLATFPFILLLLGDQADIRIWAVFLGVVALPCVFGFCGAFFSQEKNTTFGDRCWEAAKYWALQPLSIESKEDELTPLIEKPQEWFAIMLVVAFFSCLSGFRYASFIVPTMVNKADKSKALVVIYGDKWIFRPKSEVNQPRAKSKGELLVLSGDQTKEMVLVPASK